MKSIFASSRSMSAYKAENMQINFPILIFLLQIHTQIYEYVPHISLWSLPLLPPNMCFCCVMSDYCLL